jgi:hypothetical protein
VFLIAGRELRAMPKPEKYEPNEGDVWPTVICLALLCAMAARLLSKAIGV